MMEEITKKKVNAVEKAPRCDKLTRGTNKRKE